MIVLIITQKFCTTILLFLTQQSVGRTLGREVWDSPISRETLTTQQNGARLGLWKEDSKRKRVNKWAGSSGECRAGKKKEIPLNPFGQQPRKML